MLLEFDYQKSESFKILTISSLTREAYFLLRVWIKGKVRYYLYIQGNHCVLV